MEALKIKVNRVLAACALTRLSAPEKHGPRSSLRDPHSKGKLSPSELSPYVRTAVSLSPGAQIATTVMDRELASLHIEPTEGSHNAATHEVVRNARICTPENCLKDIPSAYEVENDMVKDQTLRRLSSQLGGCMDSLSTEAGHDASSPGRVNAPEKRAAPRPATLHNLEALRIQMVSLTHHALELSRTIEELIADTPPHNVVASRTTASSEERRHADLTIGNRPPPPPEVKRASDNTTLEIIMTDPAPNDLMFNELRKGQKLSRKTRKAKKHHTQARGRSSPQLGDVM